jgi:hypothetical protein
VYQTYTVNRQTGGLVALNARELDDTRVLSVNHDTRAVALAQADFNEMSEDLDELLSVLSVKVQRLASARANGATGTFFEAGVRDVLASAQRLFEKTIGRKAAA